MSEYTHLTGQFDRVRRGWKRAAALSGFALVLLESIGLFTLVVLLSLFYGHIAWFRTVLFTAAGVCVAVLLIRHVLLPVMRRIPDEQIALYVEEHNEGFQGSLITAAEFGRQTGVSPLQARMIQAVVHLADTRASGASIASVVSLAPLRKYGIAAAVALGVYIVLCVAFPGTVGRHVVAALQPWRSEATSLLAPGGPLDGLDPAEARKLEPIGFELTGGDVRVARGDDFALEATLSREPDQPVWLSFRSVADPESPGQWQRIEMGPLDRLNAFGGSLQAVSEDMEYRVGSGQYASGKHRITVYDRIEVRGIEVTTSYPEYLEFPDRTSGLTNGDVSAPVGSTVTVRVVVNTELVGGELTFADGEALELTPDPERTNSATASFPVQRNRQYGFKVTDVDKQLAESIAPAQVFALADRPPTLELLEPPAEIDTHPLGEIDFHARVIDDFGTERVDLVYLRFGEGGQSEDRIPLELARPDGEGMPLPDVAEARLTLLMEEADPPFRAGEVVSWYLEAADRKPDNPPAMSQLCTIVVVPFETWGAYEFMDAHMHEESLPISLEELLIETWDLHRRKGSLEAKDYDQRCTDIADLMVSPATGQVYDFGEAALPEHPTQRQIEAARKAQEHALKAHKALEGHDTLKASTHFRLAIAELIAADIMDTEMLAKMDPATGEMTPQEQEESRLNEMFAEAKAELEKQVGAKIEESLDRAQAAAEARQAVEQIRKEQEKVLEQAKEQARKQEDGQPPRPDEAAEMKKLGETEKNLAARAKSTATELQRRPETAEPFEKTAEKIDRASAAMRSAAKHLDEGEAKQALTRAAEADKLLNEAEGELQDKRYEELSTALTDAEDAAERILREQQRLRQRTETVGEEAEKTAKAEGDASPKQKREMKKVAFEQVKTKAKAEALAEKMQRLESWAGNSARTEAAKEVKDANRTMQRARPAQKMANAVVELNDFKPKPAEAEQRKAEKGLDETLAKLRKAGDMLATTREESLKRAVRQAKEVEEGLEELAKADEQGEEDGEAKPEPKGDGEEEDGEAKPEPKPTGEEGDEEGKPEPEPLSPQQRREQGQKVASDVRRLERHVRRRDYADDEDVNVLRRIAQDENLDKKLATDEYTQKRLRDIVARVSDRLEAELEATTKAKQSLAAQREECPPRYRLLVNKYFEALSKRGRQ